MSLFVPKRWSPAFATGAPTVYTTYGSGIGGDSLANLRVGKMSSSGSLQYSYRFKADATSTFASFTFYYIGPSSGAGYGGGTGGTWRARVYADDGASTHFPTGAALATQAFSPGTTSSAEITVTFATPASLTSGTIYHLVIDNTDADPETNYGSLDLWWYSSAGAFYASPRRHPRFTNTDLACLTYVHPSGPWRESGDELYYTPILDITYGSGTRQGMSYGETSDAVGEQGEVNGTLKWVRERFTNAGAKNVVGAGVRLYKIAGGADALVVGLYTSAGSLIDSFSVPASSVANGNTPDGDSDHQRAAAWAEGFFAASQALSDATEYYLRLSTAAGTTYWAWVERHLNPNYAYGSACAFTEGVSEKTTNGGGAWSSLGRVADRNNLQIYLLVS